MEYFVWPNQTSSATIQLFQERIGQCDFTFRKCEEKINVLKSSLQSKVSTDMNDWILALFADTLIALWEVKEYQRQKFDRIQSKWKTQPSVTNIRDASINQEKWVTNLSTHSLTENEQSVLMKGLNFSTLPQRFQWQILLLSQSTLAANWRIRAKLRAWEVR